MQTCQRRSGWSVGLVLFALLMIAGGAQGAPATGGVVTNYDLNGTNFNAHVFTNSSDTFTVGSTLMCEVLVVAGGGGGGRSNGGGGGAGGLKYKSLSIAPGPYTVTVGAGGAGAIINYRSGSTGGWSRLASLVECAGGGGGAGESGGWAATTGGSGGGGNGYEYANTNGADGIAGQGNAGGNGLRVGGYCGGGGGGAGSVGSNAVSGVCGDGGSGLAYDISGVSTGYAGGGGGGGLNSTAGAGGYGGGGAGSVSGGGAGGNATKNAGGGGGGGANAGNGGNGASGIVIVRYNTAALFIENRDPTNVTPTSACLNGYVTSPGDTRVSVYWGDTDGGAPTSGLWKTTNTWAWGAWANDTYPSYQTPGLTSNKYYFYRYMVTNADDRIWADATMRFLAGDVWVTAPDTNAVEGPVDTGQFTIQRHPDATNLALTVYYGLLGSATYGVANDYTLSPLPYSVTLAATRVSTNITLTAIFDGVPEGNEKAVLVLSNGLYAVGTPSSNVVTITEPVVTSGTNITTAAGLWTDDTKWTQNRKPINGDQVIVKHAMLLVSDSPQLMSFSISNATLTVTNWSTTLHATNVFILDGGTLTVPAAFATGQMSNRVHIVCSNLTVESGGAINADGKGFVCANGPGAGKDNPDALSAYGGGGAYGGKGGISRPYGYFAGGRSYGAVDAPLAPGSGGGGRGYLDTVSYGGPGGGAVLIEASGTVAVNGTITADGGDALHSYWGGGGSGGGIAISCATFGGSTTGLLSVNGGDNLIEAGIMRNCGGGGGGRIAVTFANAAPTHAARFSAAPGKGWADLPSTDVSDVGSIYWAQAERGTVYLSGSDLLSETLIDGLFSNAELVIPSFTTWNVSSLTVTNCSFVFAATNLEIRVDNDLVIGAGGSLGTRGTLLAVGGNVLVTNGGALVVYSVPTNSTHGMLVSVTGNVAIGSGSWIYPHANPTNGGSPIFRMNNLTVATNGGFSALARGYASQTGPGRGTASLGAYCGGGGYGGQGGQAYHGTPNPGGPVYGPFDEVTAPGSGGGSTNYGGWGGGLIRIEAEGQATIHGTLTANGGQGIYALGGGGAGGGIALRCQTLVGNGVLNTYGGNAGRAGSLYDAGGGGGGRIALDYSGLGSPHTLHFATAAGAGYADIDYYGFGADYLWDKLAHPGTVYVPDMGLLPDVATSGEFTGVNLHVSNLTSLAKSSLAIANGSLGFGPSGCTLSVTNGITIGGGGSLWIQGNLTVLSGDLVLTNGGSLSVYSLPTNGVSPDFGSLVSVTGNVRIGAGSWVYPYANGTNGGAALFRMRGLTVATNAGFWANARGYARGQGPGQGSTVGAYGGGGGHGGKGGRSYFGAAPGGVTNGLASAPVGPGSGGGGAGVTAGRGGGSVRIEASGTVTLDGKILANGGNSITYSGAGGSGGGILIFANKFYGDATAEIGAGGGWAAPETGYGRWAGGGGGGRIAVWCGRMTEQARAKILAGLPVPQAEASTNWPTYVGALSVTNGLGWAEDAYTDGYPAPSPGDGAEPGTCVFYALTGAPGTLVIIR